MIDFKEKEPRTVIDGIPVYCAYDELVDPEKLVPNKRNPNTHPDTQIQLLARIISETGWRAPITVSNLSGQIVRGHGRLQSSLLLGVKSVPVEYQHYDSIAAEYADLVADNRIAELADNKMLADIFADIDTGEIALEMTGYTEEEMERLITGLAEALHDDKPEEKQDDAPELEAATGHEGDKWTLDHGTSECDMLLVDAKTGKKIGIRLFRKGNELSREHFERMFEE